VSLVFVDRDYYTLLPRFRKTAAIEDNIKYVTHMWAKNIYNFDEEFRRWRKSFPAALPCLRVFTAISNSGWLLLRQMIVLSSYSWVNVIKKHFIFQVIKTFISGVLTLNIYLTLWSKKFTLGYVDAFYQHSILPCYSSFFYHSAFTPVVYFIIISYIL